MKIIPFIHSYNARKTISFLFYRDECSVGKDELSELKKYAEKIKNFVGSEKELRLGKYEIGDFIIIMGSDSIEKLKFIGDKLRMAHEKGIDEFKRALGKSLDYPDCCIENFIKKGDKTAREYVFLSSRDYDDFTIYADDMVFGLWFVGYDDTINYASPLLGYIPCKPDCKETMIRVSMTLSKMYLFVIKKADELLNPK